MFKNLFKLKISLTLLVSFLIVSCNGCNMPDCRQPSVRERLHQAEDPNYFYQCNAGGMAVLLRCKSTLTKFSNKYQVCVWPEDWEDGCNAQTTTEILTTVTQPISTTESSISTESSTEQNPTQPENTSEITTQSDNSTNDTSEPETTSEYSTGSSENPTQSETTSSSLATDPSDDTTQSEGETEWITQTTDPSEDTTQSGGDTEWTTEITGPSVDTTQSEERTEDTTQSEVQTDNPTQPDNPSEITSDAPSPGGSTIAPRDSDCYMVPRCDLDQIGRRFPIFFPKIFFYCVSENYPIVMHCTGELKFDYNRQECVSSNVWVDVCIR